MSDIASLSREVHVEIDQIRRDHDEESAGIFARLASLSKEERSDLDGAINRLARRFPIGPFKDARSRGGTFITDAQMVVAARKVPSVLELKTELESVKAVVIEAARRLAQSDSEAEGNALRKRASAIARFAGKAFLDLTGDEPGTTFDPVTGKEGGKFVDFLDAIYRVLRVTSSNGAPVSALSQARTLKKRRRSSRLPKRRTN